jgi:hypothetical protein
MLRQSRLTAPGTMHHASCHLGGALIWATWRPELPRYWEWAVTGLGTGQIPAAGAGSPSSILLGRE